MSTAVHNLLSGAIEEGVAEVYEGLKKKPNTEKFDLITQITRDYAKFSPHVNGFYYVSMIHGPWLSEYLTISEKEGYVADKKNIGKSAEIEKQKEINLSNFTKLPSGIGNFQGSFGFDSSNSEGKYYTGQVASDIDIPQLIIDYETITGKSRSINYASKFTYAGDFSISYVDTVKLNVFRYHSAWFKYIDLLKKGLIKQSIDEIDSPFIKINYFNSVYILIFHPFSVLIRGVIKIIGVSPVNLPMKQIIGNRSKTSLTTINQNYKSNDIVFEFYEDAIELSDSKIKTNKYPLLYEYKKDNNIIN